jgi:hypothetical protein
VSHRQVLLATLQVVDAFVGALLVGIQLRDVLVELLDMLVGLLLASRLGIGNKIFNMGS